MAIEDANNYVASNYLSYVENTHLIDTRFMYVWRQVSTEEPPTQSEVTYAIIAARNKANTKTKIPGRNAIGRTQEKCNRSNGVRLVKFWCLSVL